MLLLNQLKAKLNYKIEYGEAAFYGPKLDFMIKDSLNRNYSGTIKLIIIYLKI